MFILLYNIYLLKINKNIFLFFCIQAYCRFFNYIAFIIKVKNVDFL